MPDSQNPEKGKQEGEANSSDSAHASTPVPQEPDRRPNVDEAQYHQQPFEPRPVRLSGPVAVKLVDEGLKPFEQETLEIARKTLQINRRTERVAKFAFLAAVAAAIFIYAQFREMHFQTIMMASNFEAEVASSTLATVQVQRQLAIAQEQAAAAQNSVQAIQRQTQDAERAWITVFPQKRVLIVPNQSLPIRTSILNTGSTPATHLRGHVGFLWAERGSRINFVCSSVAQHRLIPGHECYRLPWGGILFPKQDAAEYPFYVTDPHSALTTHFVIPYPLWKELTRTRQVELFEWAEFQYDDVFHKPHFVHYCTQLTFGIMGGGPSQAARQCDSYNQVDESK